MNFRGCAYCVLRGSCNLYSEFITKLHFHFHARYRAQIRHKHDATLEIKKYMFIVYVKSGSVYLFCKLRIDQ